MSESPAHFSDQRPVTTLGPLSVTRVGQEWRFRLCSPGEMLLELPQDYEHQLAEGLRPLLSSGDKPPVVLDLQGLPALSSRQLGLMLVLHKALRSRYERLPVSGVSPGVRHLLELTRTAQFFDVS